MANAAISSPTPADLVAYSHASLCSPTLSTLEKALKNNYIRNFPGLSLKSLRKHPPKSIATAKGHLSLTRARNKSSSLFQQLEVLSDEEQNEDLFPVFAECTHFCFASVIEPQNQIFTDLTGGMVLPSSNGN